MRLTSTTGATTALLVALLGGCTSVDRAPTTPGPTPPSATTIPGPSAPATGTLLPTTAPTVVPPTSGVPATVTLRTFGGYAGRGDSVTVEPDGRWTAVDQAGSRRTGRLTPADLGRLAGLAADPRLAAEARQPTSPSRCADAFHYRLVVGNTETGYVDCTADAPPPPATQALVKLLLQSTGARNR
jgi:hypothetical protein